MNRFSSATGFSLVIALAASALAMGATSTPAQAQAGDRCNDYANQMMSFDQRARQLKCSVWNKPVYTHQQHYNWCATKPVSVAEDGLSTWGSLFQRCEFQASGSPAAQPVRPAAQAPRPAARPVQWLTGDGQSCDAVCSRGGRQAVVSGNFQNGNPFHVCRAGDNRPGFNLQPSWSRICVVPMGINKTVDSPNYACACQ